MVEDPQVNNSEYKVHLLEGESAIVTEIGVKDRGHHVVEDHDPDQSHCDDRRCRRHVAQGPQNVSEDCNGDSENNYKQNQYHEDQGKLGQSHSYSVLFSLLGVVFHCLFIALILLFTAGLLIPPMTDPECFPILSPTGPAGLLMVPTPSYMNDVVDLSNALPIGNECTDVVVQIWNVYCTELPHRSPRLCHALIEDNARCRESVVLIFQSFRSRCMLAKLVWSLCRYRTMMYEDRTERGGKSMKSQFWKREIELNLSILIDHLIWGDGQKIMKVDAVFGLESSSVDVVKHFQLGRAHEALLGKYKKIRNDMMILSAYIVNVGRMLFFLLLIIVAVNGYSSKVNLGVFWLQCNHIDHSCIYTHTRAHTHKHPHTHTQTHTDMQHTDYTLIVYDRVLKTTQSELCLFIHEC